MDRDVITVVVVGSEGPLIKMDREFLTRQGRVIQARIEGGELVIYEFSDSYQKVKDCFRLLAGEDVEITLTNAGTFFKFAVIYKADTLYKRCVKEVKKCLSPKTFAKFLDLAKLVDNLAREYPEEECDAAAPHVILDTDDGSSSLPPESMTALTDLDSGPSIPYVQDTLGDEYTHLTYTCVSESDKETSSQIPVKYGEDLIKACEQYVNEMTAEFLQEAFVEIQNKEGERRFVGILIENFFNRNIVVFATSWVNNEMKAQLVIEKLNSTFSWLTLTDVDDADDCISRLIVKLSSYNSPKCVQNCHKIIKLQIGLIQRLKYFPLNKKRKEFLRMLSNKGWKEAHFSYVLSYSHWTEVKHFEFVEVMLAWIKHRVENERPSQAKITTFWETIVAEKLSMRYEHDLRMQMVKVWKYTWPRIAAEADMDHECITYSSNFELYMLEEWVESKTMMITNKSKTSESKRAVQIPCAVVDCVKESKHWVKLQLKDVGDSSLPCYTLNEDLLRFNDDDESHYHAFSTHHWWLTNGNELVSMVTNSQEFINGIIGSSIAEGAGPDGYLLLNNKSSSISCMVSRNL